MSREGTGGLGWVPGVYTFAIRARKSERTRNFARSSSVCSTTRWKLAPASMRAVSASMTSICATASVGQPVSVRGCMHWGGRGRRRAAYLCAETRRGALHEGGGVGEEFWGGALRDPGAREELEVLGC